MNLEQEREKVTGWMLAARQEGVSVVEISRAMHWKAITVYNALRDAGSIAPIPPRRHYSSDTHGIHTRFIDGLKRVGLSPERWAHSWGYSLPEMIEYTSENTDLSDPDIKALHKALCRDFHREYLALYKRVPAEPIVFPPNPCKTYVATRDGEGRTFQAYVAELAEFDDFPKACGPTPSAAIANLEKETSLFLQEIRLNHAIAHVQRINS